MVVNWSGQVVESMDWAIEESQAANNSNVGVEGVSPSSDLDPADCRVFARSLSGEKRGETYSSE